MPQEGGKTKRAPSAYNKFMAKEIKRVKKENSKLSHQDAFKQAAGNWTKAKKSK